ncbi:DNA repair metallo-beta-lactamase [Dillenia turbinata]|uniref:DNA repair metallo-beta-lactamase n=1 Tax=Dillenia turbinata TaxID=194707 RepID=A0AAN8V901_9MAGN
MYSLLVHEYALESQRSKKLGIIIYEAQICAGSIGCFTSNLGWKNFREVREMEEQATDLFYGKRLPGSIREQGRFSLVVAFSPTGWTFGKGKRTQGKRWQQGTIIRYEVPYSEHCSFSELRGFVKFLSPAKIIPSVNNDGPESSNAIAALLLS